MKRTLCAAAVAAVAICGLMAPAGAAKKSPPRTGLTAIQFECFKQHGAFYDAETKRWIIRGGDRDMVSLRDAVTDCVARKTGKRPEPFLREERIYH